LKSLRDLIQAKELPFVGEIIDADIPEVAGVDEPATAIRWSRFKSISPTLAPGADYTADLATGVQPTPTFTESTGGEPDDPFNRREVMKADLAGHEGKVTTTKRVLAALDAAIAAGVLGRKEGSFEDCVQAVLAKPGFVPVEGHTPEESARAICATKPGGPAEKAAEGNPMLKDATAPVAPTEEEFLAAEAEIPQPDVAEMPATPSEWSLGECITHANEVMGLSEGDAQAACSLVRETYRDPGDERSILVPEGNDPTGLINAAAFQLGTQKSIKAEHQRTVTPAMKLSGRPKWVNDFKRWLGLKPAADAVGLKSVQFMQGVETDVEGIKMAQEKVSRTLEQVLAQNAQMLQIIGTAVGANLTPATVEAPAAAPAPMAAAPAGNPLMAEMKSAPAAPDPQAKEGAAAGAPVVDAPAPAITPEQLAAALQDPAIRQVLLEALGVTDDDEGLPDLVGAGVGGAPAAAAPMLRMPGPAVGNPTKRVSVASVPQERTMQVKSAQPDGGVRFSSILGTRVRRDEVAAARAELKGGGLRSLSWKR
jgi:hypothetical protein